MSCKLPESDSGIINPSKKYLDKITTDQTTTGIMGQSPFSQCSKMVEKVNTKG